MFTEIENFLPHDQCDKIVELLSGDSSLASQNWMSKLGFATGTLPGEYLTHWHILKDGETCNDGADLGGGLCNHSTLDEKILKSEFFSLHEDHPVQQVIWDVVSEFADQNNIPFSQTPGLNVAKYSKDGHMAWHTDGFNEADKISIGVQLSDEGDYDGGEFQFGKDIQGDIRTTSEDIYHDWELTQKSVSPIHTVSKAKGSLCMYDSFLYHRVTPVTRGERYVLLGWYRNVT